MSRLLTTGALLVLLALGAAPAASADPVQEFTVQLKDIGADGRYTVVYQANSYDTTGEPPPAVTESSVRLAKGIAIKPKFLKRGRFCEHPKLKELLVANQTETFQYKRMLDDLRRTRRVLREDLSDAELRVLDTCIRAQIGTGRVKVDVRPLFPDLIPAFLYLFLSPPTEPGAFAGFGVMSVTDQSAPIVRDNPLVASQKPSFTVNLFDDPTPDGLYGYRMKLPPGNVGLIKISVAELRVDAPGITDVTERRTCTARRAGKCTKHRVRKTSEFWASPPICPPSGHLQFEANLVYETGQATNQVSQVACPRFTR